MIKKRINGKVIDSYDNKLVIEISENDFAFTEFEGAEVVIEGDYVENPDM